ncbi:pyridoxal phosphate-dependent transferase [Cyathus striatus]|nr:pyridoxal phosphate-dependent transferase [Cyathus striatus]
MKYIDLDKLYASSPPPFGKKLKDYFNLDPTYVALHNGTFGTTPIPVLQAANTLSDQIETNQDLFHKLSYMPLLKSAREQVAKLIGARTDEVVFVTNASMGVTTILRNFEWEEGDVIIVSNTTYGSVYKTAQYLSDTPPHPTLSIFPIYFPTTPQAILGSFRKHVQALPKRGKCVAVIDAIVSNPGVSLPWKEMVIICKEEGIYSVIDAAHSIGQEVGINLEKIRPDFWVSNCHKWLHAKRSVAVLYVPERNQHLIKTSIPTSDAYISPTTRTRPNFVEQFEWNGTIDFTPILTVPDALNFRAWLGGEEKINEYCHDLAMRGGERLAEVMGTRVMDPEGVFTLNIVNVELPFPGSIHYSSDIDLAFCKGMLEKHNAYSTHFWHNGKWWTWAGVQVWNELEDFEKLGKAWLEVCNDVLTVVRQQSGEKS